MKTPMKILLMLASLALTQPSFSTGTPDRRITIHGEWDDQNPTRFMTDLQLREDRSYILSNRTKETITVVQIEWTWDWNVMDYRRTPREFFTVLSGQTIQFEAPSNLARDWYSLDIYLRGQEGTNKLNGRNGIRIEQAPEFETD